MKMNNRGIAAIPVLMFLAVIGFMKGVEHIDHTVLRKEGWANGEYVAQGTVGAPGSVRKWQPKFSEELKIEGGGKYGHDANSLPPGMTVDTNYVPGNKSE